ncbi:MAG TPA: S46 family peptidase [Bacteroidia bacterium]|nr:S46 family peptidase [Bacteroidia bacterium]
MMKKYFIILIYIGNLTITKADEGMWLPILLKSLNETDMQSKGCKLSADDIYNVNKTSLKDGIVHFNGGCTGEIISKEGLLITNHHCGYSQIQQHSTVEKDYLTDGFWAKNKQEELPNPGLYVTFIISMKDVTEEVLASIGNQMTESSREKAIQEKIKSIESKAKEGSEYGATVKSFYNGNQYFLFMTETFNDIRLVGAPPSNIAKFGSDTDNWMWPRHTGDFSLFRIYANKDNKPAPYNKDNVPFKPRYHFTISLSDIKEGDFTMVYGFPGRTTEYLSSYAVRMIKEVANPVKIKLREKKLEIIDGFMRNNDTIRIKYAAKYYSVANAYKKWQGENKGIERLQVISKKENEEKEFLKNAIYQNNVEASTVLVDMEMSYEKYKHFNKLKDYYNESFKASELVSFVLALKTNIEKIKSFNTDNLKQKEEIEKLKKSFVNFNKNYDKRVDQEVFAGLMKIYYDDLDSIMPKDLFSDLKNKYKSNHDLWAAALYQKSIFNNPIKTDKILNDLPSKIEKLENDVMFKLVEKFYNYYTVAVQPQFLKLDTAIQMLNRKYMGYQLKLNNTKRFYPDANGTLRVAYGKVSSYIPADGIEYKAYTTLDGAIEKENPALDEFNIHPKLKSLYAQRNYGRYADADGNMRIAFIATNHTTGGNSGSPVINANGELIGINFDRNWEGTVSDIKYDPSLVRNIFVDMHYTLFIIDKFAEAKNLIDEMSIKN